MVIAIAGVATADVEAFVAGLTQASVALGGIPARLEAARVHDVAFGKLVDAAKVRDAYHSRLPATEHNIAEARELIAHIIAQFGGAPVPDPEPITVVAVPAQAAAGPEPETETEPESAAPEQAVSAQAEPESAAPEQTAPESAAPEQAVSDSVSAEQAAPDSDLDPEPNPDPDPVTVSLPGPRTGQTADG